MLSAVQTVPSLAIARLPCLGFDLISKASKGLLFPGWRDKIITCGRSGKPHRRSTGRRSRQIHDTIETAVRVVGCIESSPSRQESRTCRGLPPRSGRYQREQQETSSPGLPRNFPAFLRWIGVVSVRKFALALRPSHRDRSRNLWQVGFPATTARHDIPVYGRPTLSSRRLFGNGSYRRPDWPRGDHSSTQTMRLREAGTAPIGLQKDGARRFRNED